MRLAAGAGYQPLNELSGCQGSDSCVERRYRWRRGLKGNLTPECFSSDASLRLVIAGCVALWHVIAVIMTLILTFTCGFVLNRYSCVISRPDDQCDRILCVTLVHGSCVHGCCLQWRSYHEKSSSIGLKMFNHLKENPPQHQRDPHHRYICVCL